MTLPTLDLNKLEGLEDFIEHMVPMMRKKMEQDGTVYPFAIICGLRDPRDGSALEQPEPIFLALAVTMQDDQDKDMVRGVLDDALNRMCGVGIAFVTEAWAVKYEDDASLFFDATQRPSQDPRREEILSVLCEHKTGGATFYHIPIVRTGDKATLGDPIKHRYDSVPMGGRFNNFFGARELYA